MMARLKAWAHSATVWWNATLLALFPFTDQIMQGLTDYLPNLAPYLPPNVYKFVGVVVVILSMFRAMKRARAAAAAKEAANG